MHFIVRLQYVFHPRRLYHSVPANTSSEELAPSQERKQRAPDDSRICYNFTRGACSFGDGCRFGHDAQAYLRGRRADLPGRCPFVAGLDACPHGARLLFASASCCLR